MKKICVFMLVVIAIFWHLKVEAATPKGDINGDSGVDLKDVILCLQIMANLNPSIGALLSDIDVNSDGKIGMQEAIYILQVVAGLRSLSDIDAPAPFTGIVTRHNFWRSQVGVSPLTWSSQVASSAQTWANELAKTCNLIIHSNAQYGENIAWGYGGMTPDQVVDMWAKEKSGYVYKPFTSDQLPYGHYTQLVWRDTTQIGCGMAKCQNNYEIWVCDYNPAGNFIGEYPY